MAPRSRQLSPALLLLLVQLSVAVVASSLPGCSYYSFPVLDDQATTDGVVVATNSSKLSPATFLFDAQLFPEFNQSEGFVLLSRPVALWRVAPDDGVREEASFNEKHGPRSGMNGTALPVAAAAVPNATSFLASVEVGSVSSYGPPQPPGVGLNVTITPNSSSSGAGTSQLAVRIAYDAVAHRLSVYANDTAAGDTTINDTAALLLDGPLDLADHLPAQGALVGFYASTVRDLVVGVRDWELTVDSLAADDVGDGPRHKQGQVEHSTSSSSSWLVILLAVLGSVAAVAAAVVSAMVYLVVARRRAVDMEVQQRYRDYFARMTQ